MLELFARSGTDEHSLHPDRSRLQADASRTKLNVADAASVGHDVLILVARTNTGGDDVLETMTWLMVAAGGTTCLPVGLRTRVAVRLTTLMSAWRWGAGAWFAWIAAAVANATGNRISNGVRDQLWYAAAVLLLCPTISILGARRPGSRWWSGFIVAPLLCVMGWPAADAWRSGVPTESLVLDAPVLIGYAFVLVMGLGNYFGTRFTLPTMLIAVAGLLSVSSFLADRSGWLPSPDRSRMLACCGLIAATWWAAIIARPRHDSSSSLERTWFDFRDTFGIVWAKRVQERFNETAHHSGWPARLSPFGFVTESGQPLNYSQIDANTVEAMRNWLRRLLRRFVDPEWIDSR
ncbi:MAG: hypothetical protein HZA46_05405 [Planctomycetales bacterium]|nr:hypothetical protein [Planctomycetales bacterium]